MCGSNVRTAAILSRVQRQFEAWSRKKLWKFYFPRVWELITVKQLTISQLTAYCTRGGKAKTDENSHSHTLRLRTHPHKLARLVVSDTTRREDVIIRFSLIFSQFSTCIRRRIYQMSEGDTAKLATDDGRANFNLFSQRFQQLLLHPFISSPLDALTLCFARRKKFAQL